MYLKGLSVHEPFFVGGCLVHTSHDDRWLLDFSRPVASDIVNQKNSTASPEVNNAQQALLATFTIMSRPQDDRNQEATVYLVKK